MKKVEKALEHFIDNAPEGIDKAHDMLFIAAKRILKYIQKSSKLPLAEVHRLLNDMYDVMDFDEYANEIDMALYYEFVEPEKINESRRLHESWNAAYDAANDFIEACEKSKVGKRSALQILDHVWNEHSNFEN